MADTLIENILAKEPHSPTATIIPDKHAIITSIPEAAGNHTTVIPNPLNTFGYWRQKVGALNIVDYQYYEKRKYRYDRL
jgi:hypothetical protein